MTSFMAPRQLGSLVLLAGEGEKEGVDQGEYQKDCKTKNFLLICLGQTLFFSFQGRDISFYSTENFQPARFQNKNQFEICAFCIE